MAPSLTILPPQSYVGWKVSISLLHALSTACTIYRLSHRFRIHRIWWDDYIVTTPLTFNILYCILTWIRFNHRIVNPISGSRSFQILNSYWLSLLPYLISVWTTRIVLALSLGRIFPDKHPARRWSYFLVIFMTISLIICALTPALTCTYISTLMILYEVKHCATIDGRYLISIVVLVTDSIVCDTLLFISPIFLFWRVKLPRVERRLVVIFFCGSILTLLIAFAFATMFLNRRLYTGEDWLLILIGMFNIEAAVSLLASNLIVVTTCLYQALRRWRNRDIPPIDQPGEIMPHTSVFRTPPCSCTGQSDRTSSSERLTLTEISTYGSSPPRSQVERPSHLPGNASVPWIPNKSELLP